MIPYPDITSSMEMFGRDDDIVRTGMIETEFYEAVQADPEAWVISCGNVRIYTTRSVRPDQVIKERVTYPTSKGIGGKPGANLKKLS